MNLKAKIYKYVNSTIQRCPNKIIKFFLIEDFFLFATGVGPASTLSCEYLRVFSKKIRNGPNGRETDSWKKQEQKISRHCPFKREMRMEGGGAGSYI